MLVDRIKTYQVLQNEPERSIKYPTSAQYEVDFVFLKEINNFALATNAQKNLNKAYDNFFRDKSVGSPKFTSKKDKHCSYITNNSKGIVYL